MTIYAITNQKGGVGKTTTTLNIAVALAEQGHRVLMVDLDPQAGLSVSLGLKPDELSESIYQVLLGETKLVQAYLKSEYKNVWYIPANLDLAGAEVELIREIAWINLLADQLNKLAEFDFVLLDCPPSLGLLTVNALVAAHRVIVPVQTQFLAFRALKSLRDLVEKVKSRANRHIQIQLLRTMFEKNTIHAQEVSQELERLFKKELFTTIIPKRVSFAESSVAGKSILTYANSSAGAKAYRALAQEILHDQKSIT